MSPYIWRVNKPKHAMDAYEVLSSPKAYTAMRALQSLNRLAEQAHNKAMSYRGGYAFDGSIICNDNAEAQHEHREREFEIAVRVQAAFWCMEYAEAYALATGDHHIFNEQKNHQ